MKPFTEHPLHRYWALAGAAIQVEALNVALNLDIFEALSIPMSATELAERLSLDVKNTAHLLELLWSMELLEIEDRSGVNRFVVADVARDYFLRGAPACSRTVWLFRQARLRLVAGRLSEQVQHGTQAEAAVSPDLISRQWAVAARVQLAEDQRAATVPAALEILESLPEFSSVRRLLDLGGGPGWVAIELARRHGSIAGTVFDLPEAASVAAENILASGMAQRLSAIGGDLDSSLPGSGYDLVWCSAVLHFVADIDAVLRQVFAALAPGGVLVSVHAEIASEAAVAARVLPWYLPLLMQGRHVLQAGEMAQRMRQAGFVICAQFVSERFPMAPHQVIVGKRVR